MRDGFVFYQSFFDALTDLDDATRLACYDAICNYAITGTVPELNGLASTIFKLIKPQLDANIERRENGKLGGRPKKNTEDIEEENHRFSEEKTIGFENEKPKEKEKEKVKGKAKGKEIDARARGELGNVLLTDEEYAALCEKYGADETQAAIEYLDEYIPDKGYKVKSGTHYLAMRRWVFDAVQERRRKAPPGNTQPAKARQTYSPMIERGGSLDVIQRQLARQARSGG